MLRHRTRDRGGGPDSGVTIHTTEQIGPNRRLLKNGNLLCLNVPIARVGTMLYGPGELPVPVGPQGVAYIERTADALFNDTTISSFQGCAVTDNHPSDDVTPDNWDRVASGYAINVRQGTGDDADVILADLMITRRSTIDAILAGKVEVSAGYDADYRILRPGAAQQSNIYGNHIAIVPKGRCGPRCAIGDEEFQPTQLKEPAMVQRVKTSATPRVPLDQASITALRERAQQTLDELDEQLQPSHEADDGVHVHIHHGAQSAQAKTGDAATLDAATEARIAGIETTQSTIVEGLAALTTAVTALTADGKAPPFVKKGEKKDDDEEDDDKKKKAKTGDSAALETGYVALLSQAEVLVPGFVAPTFDADIDRQATIDRMCGVRRKVLDTVMATADGLKLVTEVNEGVAPDVATMDCVGTAALFKGAAAAKAMLNNAKGAGGKIGKAATTDGLPGIQKKMPTLEEINTANKAFWEGKLIK